jgi:hypothetical protein
MGNPNLNWRIWNPLVNIQDAWMLVEKAAEQDIVISLMDQLGYDEASNNYKRWRIEFIDLTAHEQDKERDETWIGFSEADTAPLAICAAVEKIIECRDRP